MFLRQSKRVNCAVLNGVGKTIDEMAEVKKSGVNSDISSMEVPERETYHESFSNPHQAKRAEIEDLEAEMEALELEERAASLQQNIKRKKAAIDHIRSGTVHPGQNQQVPPGLDLHNRKEVNLGELYAGNTYGPMHTIDIDTSTNRHDIQANATKGYQYTPDGSDASNGVNTLLRLDLKPQSYLYSPEDAQRGKYRAIVDYIPTMARRSSEEEEVREIAPGLKFSTGSRVKLDTVTPAQWVAANACICADTLKKASVTEVRQVALDYQAYTAKIGELACKYTWRSVILFDDEYRDKQNQFQFRWGSDSPHLHAHLTPRQKQEDKERSRPAKAHGANRDHNHRDPTRPMPPCWNWNKDEPCTRTPCAFQHVCEWCKSAGHTKMKHDQTLKA